MRYFELKFDPRHARSGEAEWVLREEIVEALDGVESLEFDRILRNQLVVIDATLRTNAFRPERRALSFKLRRPRSRDAHAQPGVRDLRLLAGPRGRAPARGRWPAAGSAGRTAEDYRTGLGLMRAQMVKTS